MPFLSSLPYRDRRFKTVVTVIVAIAVAALIVWKASQDSAFRPPAPSPTVQTDGVGQTSPAPR